MLQSMGLQRVEHSLVTEQQQQRNPRELFLPLPSESTGREDGCLRNRKQALTRHQICQHLDLGHPSLQTEK